MHYKISKKIAKKEDKQKLLKIKKKFEENNRSTQPKELNNFFELKNKIITKLAEKDIIKLNEDYPEFKDQTIKQICESYISKAKSLAFGLFKSLSNVATFGLTNNLWSKKEDVGNILELVKNYRFNEFKKNLEKIEKKKEENKFLILIEDIKYLAKSSSPKDFELFNLMIDNMKKEKNEIEEERNDFLQYKSNVYNLNNRKEDEKEIIEERIKNDEFVENDVRSDGDMTIKLLINEESEFSDSMININNY